MTQAQAIVKGVSDGARGRLAFAHQYAQSGAAGAGARRDVFVLFSSDVVASRHANHRSGKDGE
jgi:hypothetical protein